jgi:glycyl-tRNA synthetase alpha subunit
MSQGPRFQVEQVQAQDSSTTINVVFDDSTGNMAIDYSDKYERIATALEQLVVMASTDGIKTIPAYSWLLAASMYKISVDDTGAIGLTALTDYHSKLNDIAKF